MSIKNHYDVLDLSPTATDIEIKQTYRLLASMLHPDKFPPGSKQQEKAHTKLQEINEAYSVLKDPQRRNQYDYELAQRGHQAREEAKRHFQEEQRKQAADSAQRQREAEARTKENRRRQEAEANRKRQQERLAFCVKCGTPTTAIGNFCSRCGYATDTPLRQPTTISDTPTVIGGLSYHEYSDVFRKFELAGGKWVPSFNLLAFFIGPLWYLIKGMWLKAVVLGLLSLFLISITSGAAVVVCWLYYGFFAKRTWLL